MFNQNFIKMRLTIIVFALAFVFASCGKSKQEMIEGKWKITDVTSPEPNVPDSLKEYYKEQLQQRNNELLANGYYEFKKGGKSSFQLNDQEFPGTWRYVEEKNTLNVKGEKEIQEMVFSIEELTESLFIIQADQDDQSIRMVLKKEVR